MAGFISGTSGKGGLMTVEQAQNVLQVKIPAIKAKAMEAQYGENKKAGEKYLAEYAKKAGVKKLANGVLYRVIKEGKGEMPKDTSWVRVQYEGKTIDGKVVRQLLQEQGACIAARQPGNTGMDRGSDPHARR